MSIDGSVAVKILLLDQEGTGKRCKHEAGMLSMNWIVAINQIFKYALICLYICEFNQTAKIENMNCVLIT